MNNHDYFISGSKGTSDRSCWPDIEIKTPLRQGAVISGIVGGIGSIVGAEGKVFVSHGSTRVTGIDLMKGTKLWSVGKEGPEHDGFGPLNFLPPSTVLVGDAGTKRGREEREGMWAIDAVSGTILESQGTRNSAVYGILGSEFILGDNLQRTGLEFADLSNWSNRKLSQPWNHPWLAGREMYTFPSDKGWLMPSQEKGKGDVIRDPVIGDAINYLPDGELPFLFTGDHYLAFTPREEPIRKIWGADPSAPEKRWEDAVTPSGVEGVAATRLVKAIWSKIQGTAVVAMEGYRPEPHGELLPNDGVTLCCRDMETGEIRWAKEFVSRSHLFDVVGASGILWVTLGKCDRVRDGEVEVEKGRLLAIDVATGEELWEERIDARKVIIVDGELVLTTGGKVVQMCKQPTDRIA